MRRRLRGGAGPAPARASISTRRSRPDSDNTPLPSARIHNAAHTKPCAPGSPRTTWHARPIARRSRQSEAPPATIASAARLCRYAARFRCTVAADAGVIPSPVACIPSLSTILYSSILHLHPKILPPASCLLEKATQAGIGQQTCAGASRGPPSDSS